MAPQLDSDVTGSRSSALGFLVMQQNNRKRWRHRLKMTVISHIERAIDAIFCSLPKTWKLRILLSACRAYGVESLVAEGEQGRVEGSLQDQGVFIPYLTEGTFTSYIHERIKDLARINESGTYIDIGANIGLTTIPVASLGRWQIHAIEPDPFNSALLERNLIRNGLRAGVNVHVHALSDVNGSISLRRSPTNFGDFRIAKSGEADGRYEDEQWASLDVSSRRLDDILEIDQLVRPIVVKIDTQGAEPLVFQGGEQILRSAELVVMEFWPYGMLRLQEDPILFLARLAKMFRRAEALEVSTARIIATSFQEVEEIIRELLTKRSSHHFDLVLSEPIDRVAA